MRTVADDLDLTGERPRAARLLEYAAEVLNPEELRAQLLGDVLEALEALEGPLGDWGEGWTEEELGESLGALCGPEPEPEEHHRRRRRRGARRGAR